MANVYLTIQRAFSVFLFRLTSTLRVETKLPSYYPAFFPHSFLWHPGMPNNAPGVLLIRTNVKQLNSWERPSAAPPRTKASAKHFSKPTATAELTAAVTCQYQYQLDALDGGI